MAADRALEGKRILITGGAGGVGRAVAERTVGQGARVLITDRDELQLRGVLEAVGAGDAMEAVTADLSSSIGVSALFERADAWLGGLDILIACAGVGSGPLMEMDDAGWRYVIESNLSSYVSCTKAAIDRMNKARKEGTISW